MVTFTGLNCRNFAALQRCHLVCKLSWYSRSPCRLVSVPIVSVTPFPLSVILLYTGLRTCSFPVGKTLHYPSHQWGIQLYNLSFNFGTSLTTSPLFTIGPFRFAELLSIVGPEQVSGSSSWVQFFACRCLRARRYAGFLNDWPTESMTAMCLWTFFCVHIRVVDPILPRAVPYRFSFMLL